jgi:tRNA A-37 threonylcarbamoyl transferase component Bud32
MDGQSTQGNPPDAGAADSELVQWQVSPEWSDLLTGPRGLRLAEWLDEGRAKIVKTGSHRTVYRVDLPQRTFFVKHYRCSTLLKASRHWMRESASKREYRRALEIERRHVPTARPVAVGEQRRGGLVYENYLVTEAVAQACSLDEFVDERLAGLPPPARRALRRKLLAGLARLCAAAHEAGVFHNDLHTGNVLVRLDSGEGPGDDRPQLYLIDLPGVRLSGPLGWRRSRESLVMLAAASIGRLTWREAWRFWRTYLAERPRLAVRDRRLAAADLMRRAAVRARRIAGGRDRRALRTNRDFYALSQGEVAGHAVSDLPPGQLARLMADPEALLQANLDRPIKLTHRSLVVQATLPLAGERVRVAFKRTRARSWFKAMCGLVRRGRAVDAWYHGHALLKRGIATARPIAVCEPRPIGPRWHSYLATQWIEGAENLHLYGWQLADRPAVERRHRGRQCAEALGRLLGRMHAWQISHRDLKACNLVVAERDDRIEAYLIDLDGVRIGRRLPADLRARHLARLAASLEAHPWIGRGDRLRFLRAYIGELPTPAPDWKRLWRDIEFHCRPIIKRLARGGRPVV